MFVRPFVHVFGPLAVAALLLSPLVPGAALAVPVTTTAKPPGPTPSPTATATPGSSKFVSKPYTKAVGAFFLTLPDKTKLPLSAMTYDAKEILSAGASTGAGAGRPTEAVTLTIPDADAVSLLTTQFAGKSESQIIVTAPNSTVTFTDATFGTATIAGSGTTFKMAFDKVAFTTTAPPLVDTQTAMKTGLAKPSLQIGNQGFALTSETFSTKAKASNSPVSTDGTFVFKTSDAASLIGAMGKVFANASLATADATYAFTSPTIDEATAVFDATGTPTITADLLVKSYVLTAGSGKSAPAGKLSAALPKAGGETNVPLTSLTLHLTNGVTAGTGVASESTGALKGQFTIADPASVVLAQADLQGGIHDLDLMVRETKMTLKNLKVSAITQASTGGGATTFAFSFSGLQRTTPPPGSTLGRAGNEHTAASSTIAQVSKPAITIGGDTYPLVSETVSSSQTIGVTGAATGAGIQRGTSTTDIVFTNPAPLNIYSDAVSRASLDTVDLATSAGDYKLAHAAYKSVDVAVDANGAPTINATLLYQTLTFSPSAATSSANASTFFGTFTAQKPLTKPVIPLSAGTFEIAQPDVGTGGAGVGKATLTGSLSVPTALAGELIAAAAANSTTFSTIVVSSPSGSLTLENVQIGATTSSSGKTTGGSNAFSTFALHFTSITVPPSTPPTSSTVPRLAIGNTIAYALASETFTGLAAQHTASAGMSAAVVVSDSTAIPLFGSAVTSPSIAKATLVSSAMSIALTGGRFTDVKLVLGATGQATTDASLAFATASISTP